MITVREHGRRSKKKCMAEGKKELIGLLSSETSLIHSHGFIKTCPSLGEYKGDGALITFIPGR